MMKPKERGVFSFVRLRDSFTYAIRGIIEGLKGEKNLQIHTIALVLVIALGWFLGVNRIEWMILLLCIAMVFSLELVNSAIEMLSDKVSTEYSELIKRAKDFSAAAVLFSAIFAAIIGLMIFFPYILQLFS